MSGYNPIWNHFLATSKYPGSRPDPKNIPETRKRWQLEMWIINFAVWSPNRDHQAPNPALVTCLFYTCYILSSDVDTYLLYLYICVCAFEFLNSWFFANCLSPSPNGNVAHFVALVYIYIRIYIYLFIYIYIYLFIYIYTVSMDRSTNLSIYLSIYLL